MIRASCVPFGLPGAWRLAMFFDYPREHWVYLGTTNIVESPFEAVRGRTNAARRFKKTGNAEAVIWKLLRVIETS